jgi:hypothetical protein
MSDFIEKLIRYFNYGRPVAGVGFMWFCDPRGKAREKDPCFNVTAY